MDREQVRNRRRLGLALSLAAATAISGCSSTASTSSGGSVREAAGKEYFAESEYGVKASPRVSNLRTRLPRGGGRDMVGKPYKVKGKWYKPKEDRSYSKVGGASWYGDAFHGRLTANGEVYDMTHLTAAHPTMPLPSYARVTNTANGASVIVRVNDRGPFAHNRIIDLSKKAAELLDYKHAGVAKVKVEYVGRAPLHGRDDNYLLASYNPGRSGLGKPRPVDDGLPTGVMVAMNGDTPSKGSAWRDRFKASERRPSPPLGAGFPQAAPVALAGAGAVAAVKTQRLPDARMESTTDTPSWGEVLANDPVLPDFGPSVPDRPYGGAPMMIASTTLSYADSRVDSAARAIDTTFSSFSEEDVRAAWKQMQGGQSGVSAGGAYVAAGTFSDKVEAGRLARALYSLGSVSVVDDGDAWLVELREDGRHPGDRLAELARAAGATEAFLVRE